MSKVLVFCLIALFTLGLPPNAFAQVNSKHEFSIYGGAGVSTFRYEEWNNTDRKDKFGGLFGLGHSYFFSEHWGLNTGVEAAFYYAGLESSMLTSTYMANNGSVPLLYKSTQSAYYERQRSALIQIPLMVQYQTGGKHKFYTALGVKLGIPVESRYKQVVGGTTTSGYYPLAGVEVTGPSLKGFGSYDKYESKDDLDFKLAGLASIEAGMKWRLSEKLSLYTGIYFDHGITNINKGGFKRSVEFTGSTPNHYNSMNLADFKGTDVNPVAVGVKVKLSMFGGKCKKASPAPVPAPEPKPKPTPAPKPVPTPEPAPTPPGPATRPVPEKLEPTLNENATLAMPITDFQYSKDLLSAEMKGILDSKAEVLKKYPEMKINCVGHTCNTGGDFDNIELGMKRAQAIKDYLVSRGVPESRIGLDSKGEQNPAYPNDTQANKSKNRRVEFIVY